MNLGPNRKESLATPKDPKGRHQTITWARSWKWERLTEPATTFEVERSANWRRIMTGVPYESLYFKNSIAWNIEEKYTKQKLLVVKKRLDESAFILFILFHWEIWGDSVWDSCLHNTNTTPRPLSLSFRGRGTPIGFKAYISICSKSHLLLLQGSHFHYFFLLSC